MRYLRQIMTEPVSVTSKEHKTAAFDKSTLQHEDNEDSQDGYDDEDDLGEMEGFAIKKDLPEPVSYLRTTLDLICKKLFYLFNL